MLVVFLAVTIALGIAIAALGCGIYCSGALVLGFIIMIVVPLALYALFILGARRIVHGKAQKSDSKRYLIYAVLTILMLLAALMLAEMIWILPAFFILAAITSLVLSIWLK